MTVYSCSLGLQLSFETQRLEELAIKQSRQLIPVTPSVPKSAVRILFPSFLLYLCFFVAFIIIEADFSLSQLPTICQF